MIKYGDPVATELTFAGFHAKIEEKPQWMNIYLEIQFPEGTILDEDLTQPSAMVICTYDGRAIEYVILNEGCDSEFQFTEAEKQQIDVFITKLLTNEA